MFREKKVNRTSVIHNMFSKQTPHISPITSSPQVAVVLPAAACRAFTRSGAMTSNVPTRDLAFRPFSLWKEAILKPLCLDSWIIPGS